MVPDAGMFDLVSSFAAFLALRTDISSGACHGFTRLWSELK
jgi:hypothetical protein